MFAGLFGFCGTLLAADAVVCPICHRIRGDSVSYSAKAGSTLTRGATNTLFGWTELIRQPVDEVKQGGNVVTGMGKGVGQALKRTSAGLAEVLTFWTPKVRNRYFHFADDCPLCMGQRQ